MVGGARSMTKYYKNYNGNTLLDRLTPSDIAYSVLVYYNSYDMWKDEIFKCETCQTVQEKQAFQHTASMKYHVKQGKKLCCSRTDGHKTAEPILVIFVRCSMH